MSDWTSDPYFLAMTGKGRSTAKRPAGRGGASASAGKATKAASTGNVMSKAARKAPISAVEELAKLQYKDLIRPPGVEEGDEEFEEDEEEEAQTLEEQAKDLEKGKGKEKTPDSKRKPKAKQGDDDWPWKISSMGNVILDEMLGSASDTNPDRNGIDLASNFHSFGCLEVLERRIMKFTKELTREQMEFDLAWYYLEVTGYFLVSGYDYWLRIDADGRPERALRLLGAMCFAFISKLPNGAADLKQIKNAPAIFGAIFQFLKGVLDLAPSLYKPILSWAPTLLAILEDAGVEVWNGHGALEIVKEKMGDVIDEADKLQAARQKWMLENMLEEARAVGSFGGTAHDLSKWTKTEKENGRLGPLRAKRMESGTMYTSSDDEFTDDDKPAKRGKAAGKRGGGRGRARKRVRSYC